MSIQTTILPTGQPSGLPAPVLQRPAVQLVSISKQYGRGDNAVHALRGVTAALPTGTFTAVMGPSGSGKSTLLHVAAGLDRPTAGSVHIGDTDLGELSETGLTKMRRRRVGFVFQAYNLLPALTVAQNIGLPARLSGSRADRRAVVEIAEQVGLAKRLHHRPSQLSGGQQQRVAIARALVMRPDVLFADEPTGALDSRTGAGVLDLMRHSVDDHGLTIVMVTHDPIAASRADGVLFLADGQIVDHIVSPTAEVVAERMTHLEG
jgi:putative ABC transport system ATP-binding protein